MRRIDKELFKVFRETGVIQIYDEISGFSVDKLSLMLRELNEMEIPPRLDIICRAAVLKTLDQAKGREKALR